ncbi:MAG: hypothetical protein ABJI60_18385 [Kangiellaceae bacterium]
MSDEFIVMIKVRGEYSFYTCTEPDLWVIDNSSYGQAFVDAGHDISYIDDSYERCDTGTLEISNVDLFLKKIESSKVEPELLNELLSSCLPTDDWWEIREYIPQLIYNFDEMIYCSYHEQHIFDKFITDEWSKSDSPFLTVPKNRMYWVVAGENLLEREWRT